MDKSKLFLIFFIFIFGILIRIYYVFPNNIIFGFDQLVDFMAAKKIVDFGDLIVRETIPNSLGINHGVLFSYLTAIPYFIGHGNPIIVAYWQILLNTSVAVFIFVFIYFVFKKYSWAFISFLLSIFSFRMILISGWISITTATLYLVIFFFLGLWVYKQGKSYGLVVSAFVLGLMIQSQLLLLYNAAIFPIYWHLYRLKIPKLKVLVGSCLAFGVAISTIIISEYQSNFSNLKILLKPHLVLNETTLPFLKRLEIFISRFVTEFGQAIFPQYKIAGILILLLSLLTLFINRNKSKDMKTIILFLFAPVLMLFIGFHDQQWSLFGVLPAVFIVTGYLLTNIKNGYIRYILLGLITFFNIQGLIIGKIDNALFIRQEPSSMLINQLKVVDYTYQKAGGDAFAINTVTYPLYYNTYWSYHYPWYGYTKYGYLPNWSGGDQLYPFNTLPTTTNKEKIFFMIVDNTQAIPEIQKQIGLEWGNKYGKLVSQEMVGGFIIQKFSR